MFHSFANWCAFLINRVSLECSPLLFLLHVNEHLLYLGGSLQMQPTYIVYYGLSRQHFRSFWIYFQDLDFVVASILWTDLSIHLWYTQILWETWDSLVITWMLCCWNRMERIKCMFLMLNLYNQTSNHENAIIKIGKILSFYEYIINGFYHTLLSSNLNIKFNM